MGKFDRFNEQMVDRLHERWLNPPDEIEDYETCCSCYREAEYEIMGRYFCESCAKIDFADYSTDEEECCMCGEVIDMAYRVGGDTYCEDCFKSNFKL